MFERGSENDHAAAAVDRGDDHDRGRHDRSVFSAAGPQGHRDRYLTV